MKSPILTIAAVLFLTSAFAVAHAGDGHRPPGSITGTIPEVRQTISEKTRRIEVEAASTLAGAEPFIMAQSTEQSTVPSVTTTDPVVDESALRYFASKGDRARLEAEIARLRALYPNWTPPADPLAIPENADRQLVAMWKLYSEEKYPELRKAIVDRQASEPGWKPPTDLMDRLAVAEKRLALVAASDAKKYDDVLRLGADTPSLLTCSDVDILWRVAEAFVRTNKLSRADDAYSYILTNCTKQPERLATIQKAAVLLGYDRMQALLRLEKTLPDGTKEFEPLRDDLARRFVAEGGKNVQLVIDEPYLQRMDALLARDGKASDALLLGWYHFNRKAMAPAERYFRRAREIEDSASASQGLALVLIAGADARQAEEVMYRWRESSEDASATYFAATANLLAVQPPPVIEPDVLRRMAEAVTAEKEVTSAEEFGWYALAFKQPRTAAQWFRLVLQWRADHEPAAYGLAIARLRLRDMAGVRQIQKLWAGRSERIANVTRPDRRERVGDIPAPDGTITDSDVNVDPTRMYDQETDVEPASADEADNVARPRRRPQVDPGIDRQSTNRGRSVTSQRGCYSSIEPQRLTPSAALTRGWCLMNLNRPIEAAAAFEVALRSGSAKAREDAAYGQSLAYLRADLVDEAAISATRARQRLERAVELQAAILADRATHAFDAGRYRETILYLDQLAQLRSERTDLMVLRGYAYKSLGRHADAVRIFEALATTGNRDAIRALGVMSEIKTAR